MVSNLTVGLKAGAYGCRCLYALFRDYWFQRSFLVHRYTYIHLPQVSKEHLLIFMYMSGQQVTIRCFIRLLANLLTCKYHTHNTNLQSVEGRLNISRILSNRSTYILFRELISMYQLSVNTSIWYHSYSGTYQLQYSRKCVTWRTKILLLYL